MATPTEPVVATAEPVLVGPQVTAERSTIVSPLGWSAIFAGAAVAIGLWFVLHLLGIGIGLTAINPNEPSSLRGVGIGTGVWGLLAPLIALFIGGLVAGRVAPTINTLNAVIHAVVVWAITALVSLLLIVMAVSAAVRGVTAAGGAVVSAASTTVSALPSNVTLEDLGITTDDLVGPINQRLRAQGMPPVTAEQLQSAARQALRTSVREGRFDREQMVRALTANTALTREEAERVADRVQQRAQALLERAGQAGEQTRRTALQAAEATGKLLLVLSLVMLAGLVTAIIGSIIAVRRERREHVVLPRAQTRSPIVSPDAPRVREEEAPRIRTEEAPRIRTEEAPRVTEDVVTRGRPEDKE